MKFKINIHNIKTLLILSGIFMLSGCDNMILMHPKGQIGLEERSLILISLGLMSIIIIPVIIMTIIFSIKYRSSNKKRIYNPNWSNSNKLECIMWLVPIIIIIFLGNLTWKSTYKLDPGKSIISNNKSINIEVIALDWKWLFIYPDQGIATINEVVFPINTPIKFNITSNSVMNSFFIPQLGSQIYAMNGMNSVLNLIANESGYYKGISSNFSGKGFSGMNFTTIVTPNKITFNKWIQKVKNSSNSISTVFDYEKITQSSEYHPVEYFSSVKNNLFYDIINGTISNHKSVQTR